MDILRIFKDITFIFWIILHYIIQPTNTVMNCRMYLRRPSNDEISLDIRRRHSYTLRFSVVLQ